eukprot:PhM_4_TR18826/c0_g1_i2/m.95692
MSGEATRLVSWKVIEPTHRSGWVHPMFKVPKGEEARLIVDCRRLNEVLPRPGNMHLPDMRDIFRKLLKCNVMSQYDGRSYFYQIPLLPEVRHLFQVKLGGARGIFTRYQLTVLPMGFSYAPGIAQAISRIVLQNCETRGFKAAWVDNFVFGANSIADMEVITDKFKHVCETIGLELKPDRTESETEMEVLGAFVNTDRREISVGPKMARAIDLTIRDMKKKRKLTRRDVFVATGKILWVVWAVAQVPLALAEGPIKIMSTVGREIEDNADWNDDTDSVQPQVLIKMLAEAKQLAFLHTSNFMPSLRTLTAWTDASCTALGYVIRSEDGVIGWQRPGHETNIFLRELWAAAEAVATVSKHGDATVVVDNTAAARALIRGYSTSPLANAILRAMFAKVGQHAVEIAWTESSNQSADALSRGEPSTDVKFGPWQWRQTPMWCQWPQLEPLMVSV